MASKYNDPTAVIQVIGCVFNDVRLLDLDDTYSITDDDFCDEFHRVVFGAMYRRLRLSVFAYFFVLKTFENIQKNFFVVISINFHIK